MLALITGGSGSGKSAYAESLCVKLQEEIKEVPMLYIATMYPFDEEAYRKIERHRELRKNKNFNAIECFTNLEQITLDRKTTVLLECMSNLTANEMYQEGGAGADTVEAVCRGLDRLCSQAANVVVVSNEIFSDGIEYDPETVRYQQYLGCINQYIAKKADLAAEIVYGIPLIHKGEALI
ncbi:MAG: bifunctional adenosylcobinamide kinase/adenosylcobinamide-phosphate guanylyltransferase [Lachnospiraceae bacterium]|nr:bifunctional adenosylcobinamide kinase/adenosylcobinamide-phosphate guanylyltransferase [Lachnospiraceae bacterium]